MSLIKTNRTASGAAELRARAKDRAKDVAAQAVPVGKRAGTTAVHGVRQGVQDAKEWATPRLEDAVQGIEGAVQGAREWAAPRIEEVAEAVTTTVAPKVSSALRSTARQVRPSGTKRTGIRRLLSWRWLLGVGAVIAAAGAGAAVTMRRRYASATAEAKNDATESPAEQAGEPGSDAAMGSEVNGRVTTPGT